MKRLVILGSTGSIGTQTLDIVRRLPDRFQIVGLSANSNVQRLVEQAKEFHVPYLAIGDREQEPALNRLLKQEGVSCEVFAGVEGMCALATLPHADLVVVAVAGAIGIAPTHAAITAGKTIALASKEVLVAAGELTMALAKAHGVAILPIDSEHSALFQCLQGADASQVERLLLTASGGPFRSVPKEALHHVTPAQALRHPTWNMGGLVTINSATLMNKALEIIEAHWLFGVPADHIEVVIHPQSIVHSMVRFRDGSTLAQMGLPDMRLPIQYALVYPERIDTNLPRMRLADFTNLTFEEPDEEKFPALGLARAALAAGGTVPAVMNAANEAAVDLFLRERIPFLHIIRLVEEAIKHHTPQQASLENVLQADKEARAFVYEKAKALAS
ncbi:1-deoxy-D-xylulose 5-phosphate reductoisomerase [Chthonomonas calidirosea]|uniref:1-deoxy-D-xylulose 5-phosphate reductoisomerase n=1 Tax=Chthonomonas calidirosea (strain DSM 23976 / ICMP 18418 / T49) TaxID=1303518 RepID=S0EUI8_CHTCT|nr:1-deoxy-D-xylulose-5-phosphate reductoisomerase [Chthonomonas calidirosea]CCW35350.1 1-deoxy-D-xylulose 5-phosphate reductoisomerase [Chthonomonas calidirosea T49]CEK19561.1 1-deoxy-D-xylulose 5-phosphate reductoisomerase [Chthonomonas calidirosea]CEK19562.1 1-deoxy-D-xylulose 5-phosphate reductoisomerase [Chthonomonas calidirosea]CEK20536.1 1-deoxy-D-xylulose 5-phosphate reductoisomerase [Chthonomonas calidirosea]